MFMLNQSSVSLESGLLNPVFSQTKVRFDLNQSSVSKLLLLLVLPTVMKIKRGKPASVLTFDLSLPSSSHDYFNCTDYQL